MYNDKSFIEVQFPVSKVSKESYKERKAGSNQTLTGLGKWWGRKPLVLIRATLLGVLLPVSNDPQKDREVFLKLMAMDNTGLLLRKNKPIPTKELQTFLSDKEKEKLFQKSDGKILNKFVAGTKAEQKKMVQELVFSRMTYDEKLKYCLRPEEVNIVEKKDWELINSHLKTNATNLDELIKELGERKFGKKPKLGDCFSGGGSIPFEAARIGFETYASDLNPLAGLLTWGALNILTSTDSEIKKLKEFQDKVYDEVVKQVEKWGIENNEMGMKSKYYLYCHETKCPECGVTVPLSPNWVISEGYKTIAKLHYNETNNNYDIKIINSVTSDELKNAKNSSTIKNGNLSCPNCNNETPITVIRKDRRNKDGKIQYGLRKWEQIDFKPQESDVFQDRLYCIKYIDKFADKSWEEVMKKPAPATDASYGKVYYLEPTEEDIQREKKVIELLEERFYSWQEKGIIPNSPIEKGDKTDEPIRTRGWSYWHQLFNPRQLLILGLFSEKITEIAKSKDELVIGMLGLNKCADWNSKLAIWNTARDVVQATYTNQALNTLYNHATRSLASLYPTWIFSVKNVPKDISASVELGDARTISENCDIWITDPPYADAINYHELTEFFLAWDKNVLNKTFPDWYSDSKRVLAVRGTGESFNHSMIEIYNNLASNMPENGIQIVMFTHQDVKVWAELSLILWSAGLQVTAAWNIATETDSGGLKNGNYVKGTVILVLRKQNSDETAYLDELYPDIEDEVKTQIDNMKNLDDLEDPNFSDPDYLLAAYAASLKVLTSFKQIEDIDVQYELSKSRVSNEDSPIVKIIQEAVKIAYDYMIPAEFDNFVWKTLSAEERFYIKGLELEKNNIYQISSYQELARGFGVNEYGDLLQNTRANNARLKTANEFTMRKLNDNSQFGNSLLRKVFAAIYLSVKEEDTLKGRSWLKSELEDYWNLRTSIIEILSYVASIEHIENMQNWEKDAYTASILKELIINDGI